MELGDVVGLDVVDEPHAAMDSVIVNLGRRGVAGDLDAEIHHIVVRRAAIGILAHMLVCAGDQRRGVDAGNGNRVIQVGRFQIAGDVLAVER